MAMTAAEALQKLGYSQPISLAGGFGVWKDAGGAVARPDLADSLA